MQKPIGLTIISPSYACVGKEAVRRFRRHTGLKVIEHHCADAEGFNAKLHLDGLAPGRRVVFFDADYWLLDKAPFADMQSESVIAVHDPATFNPHAFPHADCERFAMPKTEYFNSGLMLLDFSRESHVKLFQTARSLKKNWRRELQKKKPEDTTDQFWLNLARLRCGIPFARLPSHYNFYLLSAYWGQQAWIPRHIVGLHGAGIPARAKLKQLQQQAAVFSHPQYPVRLMHPEANAFEVTRMIELR